MRSCIFALGAGMMGEWQGGAGARSRTLEMRRLGQWTDRAQGKLQTCKLDVMHTVCSTGGVYTQA